MHHINTVKDILIKLRPIYEKYHLVKIDDEILELIVNLSEKYIYNRNEPDRSIDILDEVCASVSLKENNDIKKYNEINNQLEIIKKEKNEAIINNKYQIATSYKEQENELLDKLNNLEISLNKKISKKVTKEDIALVISNKTKIPVYEILNKNNTVIKEIEKNIKSKIIGQDNILDEVFKIIRKIKLGYKDNKCYSMLFMGSSGVGKTEVAKLTGESLVGKENIIKLDMSEYCSSESVNKIVGAPPGYVGYDDFKNILETIKNKPYSVLILDEIEKAHPNVINLFLQILEDGKIKDSNSNTIRFDNVIIIMTSNIGFSDINVGFCKQGDKEILSKLKEYFSVSFINRIDNVIVFNQLKEKDILYLINQKINNIFDKYKNMDIKISNNVKHDILELSNYKEFGARKLEKIIKDKIENIIIDNIINNESKINIDSIKEHI